MLKENQKKINLLNENKYFSNDSMNKIGREYIKFLQSTQYFDLFNPEPVNPEKNTLSMALNYLKNIDEYLEKPIEKYTREDITNFIDDFVAGKIKGKDTRIIYRDGEKNSKVFVSNKSLSISNLKRHVHAFKRFWAVYRQYVIHVEKNTEIIGSLEWGTLVRAPKMKHIYVKYPYATLQQIVDIAESLCKPEYTARVLLSINLMGRKCEISALKFRDIDTKRDKEKVFIKLPDIKKYSADKVPVELFDYAKKRLKKYIQLNKFDYDDLLFPSKEGAFAKELGLKSEIILGKGNKITPKTLRKLGVCVARELGIDRTTVEDIGGWQRNSPVLEHYYSRVGVVNNTDSRKRADIIENEDVYVKMDKMSAENKHLQDRLALLEKLMINNIKQKTKINLPDDFEELREVYTAKMKKIKETNPLKE